MCVAGGATGSGERLGVDLRQNRGASLVKGNLSVDAIAPVRPVHTGIVGGVGVLLGGRNILGDILLVFGIRLAGELHSPPNKQRGDKRNTACTLVATGDPCALFVIVVHFDGIAAVGVSLRFKSLGPLIVVRGLLLGLLLGGIHNESSFSVDFHTLGMDSFIYNYTIKIIKSQKQGFKP